MVQLNTKPSVDRPHKSQWDPDQTGIMTPRYLLNSMSDPNSE